MNDRDRMRERILTALSALGAVNESAAVSLWAVASKIADVGERVSIRWVRRTLEVLSVEGAVMHDDEGRSHHDEPTRFWLRSEEPLSDPCGSVLAKRNSVREAHEHEEMQLPSLDLDDDGADLGSDG